jgi:hypothetical protein
MDLGIEHKMEGSRKGGTFDFTSKNFKVDVQERQSSKLVSLVWASPTKL